MIPKDQTLCPKCGRMYCEGYWKEGVCVADMGFCGEPTADGDLIAGYVRVWYEAHREGWRDRYRQQWTWAADEFMLGLIQEVGRVHQAHEAYLKRVKG